MTEEEFWKIYLDVPDPAPIFYRAYYNDHGLVEFYTMEDLPGNYIETDQPTYVLAPRAKVVAGKLVEIKRNTTVQKLKPSIHGTQCHSDDVCVVVNQVLCTKWSLDNNEQN